MNDCNSKLCTTTIPPLHLSATALTLSIGKEGSVGITSGSGSYTALSDDKSVATATIQDNSVHVAAIGIGSASVTVTDTRNGLTAVIDVTVTPAFIFHLTCPDENHPHMIDLGLPSGIKWACCNVDATAPEVHGGYYAWGEAEEKAIYSNVAYLYSTGLDLDGDGWYDSWTTARAIGSRSTTSMGENSPARSMVATYS